MRGQPTACAYYSFICILHLVLLYSICNSSNYCWLNTLHWCNRSCVKVIYIKAWSQPYKCCAQCTAGLNRLVSFWHETSNLGLPYVLSSNPLLIILRGLDCKPRILDPKLEEFPCLVRKLSVTLYNVNRSEKWGKKYTNRGLKWRAHVISINLFISTTSA